MRRRIQTRGACTENKYYELRAGTISMVNSLMPISICNMMDCYHAVIDSDREQPFREACRFSEPLNCMF